MNLFVRFHRTVSGRKNLAVYKPVLASQSIDGFKVTDTDVTTCVATDANSKNAQEWLKVDLLRKRRVGLVRIRATNSDKTFIEGAKVYVDGGLCGTVGSLGTGTIVDVTCSATLEGSVVVVIITTSDSVTKISACEIEVYEGKPIHN